MYLIILLIQKEGLNFNDLRSLSWIVYDEKILLNKYLSFSNSKFEKILFGVLNFERKKKENLVQFRFDVVRIVDLKPFSNYSNYG